jgi:hypothetical protein
MELYRGYIADKAMMRWRQGVDQNFHSYPVQIVAGHDHSWPTKQKISCSLRSKFRIANLRQKKSSSCLPHRSLSRAPPAPAPARGRPSSRAPRGASLTSSTSRGGSTRWVVAHPEFQGENT